MRCLAAAAAAVAATAGVGAAAPVSASAQLPARPVVEQGNGRDSVCTVGHNDPAQLSSFTSAHCGTAGQLVYLEDEQGQRINTPVGHFTPSTVYRHPTKYTGSPSANDWGQIRWFSTVDIAENAYGPLPRPRCRQPGRHPLLPGRRHRRPGLRQPRGHHRRIHVF